MEGWFERCDCPRYSSEITRRQVGTTKSDFTQKSKRGGKDPHGGLD